MWSRLQLTSFGEIVRTQMNTNNTAYHNWSHVNDCYSFLEKNNVPYDADLDMAVLFHDSIYDADPDKELRSWEFCEATLNDAWMHPVDLNTERVKHMILSTYGHKLDADNVWMLKADLSGLTNPGTTLMNYMLLAHEAKFLYGVDDEASAQGSIKFMTAFRETMLDNFEKSCGDPFWDQVADGCDNTIAVAKMFIEASHYG